MAISKKQPMRPVEIELVDFANGAESDIAQLQEDLQETNRVVGELNSEIEAEIENRKSADNELKSAIAQLQEDFSTIPVFEYGTSASVEVLAQTSADVDITFANEKESTPHILITLENTENPGSVISDCYGIIVAADNTGFSVRIHNFSTTNPETVTINWLAIGE